MNKEHPNNSSSHPPHENAPSSSSRCRAAVLTAALAYFSIMSWACHSMYLAHAYQDFDLASHSQSIWAITQGSLDASIFGIPFLGNHMVLIFFLLAPAYAIVQTPLLLLYIQTMALALGAWTLYVFARRHISPAWATALSLAYLVYPPLISMNLYEFHPIALTVPLFLLALHFIEIARFRLFIGCLILAMTCQENVSLIAIAFAFYAFIRHRRGRWIATPLALGLFYFVVVVLFVMPQLNANRIQFVKLYQHLGSSVPEILTNLLLHPIQAARHMFTVPKADFLNALLGPLAYSSLAGPSALLPCLPVLAQRLLSTRMSETSILYHYQAEFIPFVFASSVFGIKRILTLKHRLAKPVLAILLVTFPLLSLVTTGVIPAVANALSSSIKHTARSQSYNQAISMIDKQESVLATFRFLPHLANRSNTHSFHHVYSGTYTLSDHPFPTPALDSILVDTFDPLTFSSSGFFNSTNYLRLRAIIDSPQWTIDYQKEGIFLFRKGAQHQQGITPPLTICTNFSAILATTLCTNFVQNAPNIATLAGYTLSSLADQKDTSVINLYWKTGSQQIPDFDMLLSLQNNGSIVYHNKTISPGSRFWPPREWPTNTVVRDQHMIHLQQPINNPTQLIIHLFPAASTPPP